MKKSILAGLVAVAAFGFSNTTFAAPPHHMGGSDLTVGDIAVTEIDTEIETEIDVDESINAAWNAPAAGGSIGQVAYDAPAVGGDMIEISAHAVAIQMGEVDPMYPDLVFMGSGGVIAGSGDGADGGAGGDAAAAAASNFFAVSTSSSPGGNGAAGGDSGNVAVFGVETGAVSTGAITIDLSNTATALAIGGSYNYGVQPE